MNATNAKVHDLFSVKRVEFKERPRHLAEFLASVQQRSPAAKPAVLLLNTVYGAAEDSIACIRLVDLLQLVNGLRRE